MFEAGEKKAKARKKAKKRTKTSAASSANKQSLDDIFGSDDDDIFA